MGKFRECVLIDKERKAQKIFKYPFLVQFHCEVPVEAAFLGVVARPKVLPDPIIPDSGHQDRGSTLS